MLTSTTQIYQHILLNPKGQSSYFNLKQQDVSPPKHIKYQNNLQWTPYPINTYSFSWKNSYFRYFSNKALED